MRRHPGDSVTLVAVLLTAALTAVLTAPSAAQQPQPETPAQKIAGLEREVDLLRRQVAQLNKTLEELAGLMDKLNLAVRDPEVQKRLTELRAARQPVATGKARKLSELSEEEKAELKQIEGLAKLSADPVEVQGRLALRLWDFCVYDESVRELAKLFKVEAKSDQEAKSAARAAAPDSEKDLAEARAGVDRWRQVVAARLNQDFAKFDRPAQAEGFLKTLLQYPVIRQNEAGLTWLNNCGSVAHKLYTAGPNEFRAYLAKAAKLYEASLKLNPQQQDVRDALATIRKAQ